ncbi:MAG: YncE family protein, partial [Isosphaeraceae bacterium]
PARRLRRGLERDRASPPGALLRDLSGIHVAIIDLKTLTEVGRLKTGRSPDGMAWLDTEP